MKKNYPSIFRAVCAVLILFAIIPTFCAGLLESAAIQRSYRLEGEEIVGRMAEAQASALRQIVLTVENTARLLAENQMLQSICSRFATGNVTLSEEIDAYRSIKDELELIRIDRPFHNVRVFLPDSQLATQEGTSVFGVSALSQAQLPAALASGNSNCGWTGVYTVKGGVTGEHVPILSYYYRAAHYRSSKAPLVIAIDVANKTLLDSIMSNAVCEGSFALLDADGSVLLAYDGTSEAADYATSLPVGMWQFEVAAPMRQFSGDLRKIVWLMLIVLILCVGFIPLAAYYIARRLTRGISELNASNQQAAEGTYVTVPINGATWELRELQNSHNMMITRITDLIHNIYEEKLARQEAEIISLFEQIKPHFLYNTLESGKWMAFREDAPQTANFLESMALMFRLSLNKGEPFVHLSQELRHVELYVDLINKCSDHQTRLQIDASEEARQFVVLKLILQPLVENAIEHGIRESGRAEGLIAVQACLEARRMVITVADNGVVLDDDTLRALNEDRVDGYGVHNIRRRMAIYYADSCRLTYSRNEPTGLRARIEIDCEA